MFKVKYLLMVPVFVHANLFSGFTAEVNRKLEAYAQESARLKEELRTFPVAKNIGLLMEQLKDHYSSKLIELKDYVNQIMSLRRLTGDDERNVQNRLRDFSLEAAEFFAPKPRVELAESFEDVVRGQGEIDEDSDDEDVVRSSGSMSYERDVEVPAELLEVHYGPYHS